MILRGVPEESEKVQMSSVLQYISDIVFVIVLQSYTPLPLHSCSFNPVLSFSATLPWLEVPKSTRRVGRQRQRGCRGSAREHHCILFVKNIKIHRFWRRASRTCSTQSFRSRSRRFSRRAVSALLLAALNSARLQRYLPIRCCCFACLILDFVSITFFFYIFHIVNNTQDPVEGEERCQSQCLVNEECQYRELCCK